MFHFPEPSLAVRRSIWQLENLGREWPVPNRFREPPLENPRPARVFAGRYISEPRVISSDVVKSVLLLDVEMPEVRREHQKWPNGKQAWLSCPADGCPECIAQAGKSGAMYMYSAYRKAVHQHVLLTCFGTGKNARKQLLALTRAEAAQLEKLVAHHSGLRGLVLEVKRGGPGKTSFKATGWQNVDEAFPDAPRGSLEPFNLARYWPAVH